MTVYTDDYTEIMRVLRLGSTEDLEELEQMLDNFPEGTDDVLGQRWITNAIECGSLSSFEWMIRKGVKLVFDEIGGYGVIASCIETESPDKYKILDSLIKAGADLNQQGFDDWTPLHQAAVHEDWKALEMLLDAGADKTIRTRIDDCTTPAEEARLLGREKAARYIEEYKKSR